MNIGWTTLASLEDAQKMAAELVAERLAACVQIAGPINSYYLWHGELETTEEYRLTIKFLGAKTEKLEAWLRENHPYEVPQWLAVPADRVGTPYKRWAEDEAGVKQVKKMDGHSAKKEVLRLSKQGRNFLRKKRFQEAEASFMEALELDDKNSYILVGLADTCREMKKFEQAISYYEKVLEFDSVNVFALRGIGDAYRGILQHKRAIPYWMRYLECNKNDIYVMVRLAESFNKTGNFEKAESFYLMAMKVNGEDKYALLGLGSLYYKVEDDDKALEYFDKLLALDDSYVAVLTMVGNIYRRRRSYELASQYYEKAANLESWNSFALFGLGDCHRGMADLEQAIFWWSKILENEPNNQDLLTRVGDAMLSLNKFDNSLEHYMRSLKVGFDLYALLGMSRLYRTQANFSEAEKCCLEILEKVPDHARVMEELLAVYQGLGDTDKIAEVEAKIAVLEEK
jgi:tetratricopeptide (TPR) repeat protein